MEIARARILVAMLICAGLAGLYSAGSDVMDLYRAKKGLKTVDTKHPKALELVDKYAQTQDKLQSFRLKSESVNSSADSYSGGQERVQYRESDFRFDGKRSSLRGKLWGDFGMNKSVLEEHAKYLSTLYDGESFIRHSRRTDFSTGLGRVRVYKNKDRSERLGKEQISMAYDGHALMGYFDGDEERIDLILRQAKTIFVREKREQVGVSKCFVIDADTSHGKYTVWIDPEHGYNIAQAVTQKVRGQPCPQSTSDRPPSGVLQFDKRAVQAN